MRDYKTLRHTENKQQNDKSGFMDHCFNIGFFPKGEKRKIKGERINYLILWKLL